MIGYRGGKDSKGLIKKYKRRHIKYIIYSWVTIVSLALYFICIGIPSIAITLPLYSSIALGVVEGFFIGSTLLMCFLFDHVFYKPEVRMRRIIDKALKEGRVKHTRTYEDGYLDEPIFEFLIEDLDYTIRYSEFFNLYITSHQGSSFETTGYFSSWPEARLQMSLMVRLEYLIAPPISAAENILNS